MEPVIRIEKLEKSFGSLRVLKGIDLEVMPGEVVCIIGASGSGKSTLLRCINLLEYADAGHIWFDGKDLMDLGTDLNALRQRIGMVFQSFNLFNNKNVLDNCTMAPMTVKKIKRQEAEATAIQHLQEVGLGDFIHADSRRLSGGQKQRVAIARMLMQNAPVMIFDDSLSAVDAETDTKIRHALRDTLADATVILISHRVTTLMQADRILVLDQGRIRDIGNHQELIARPGIYKEIYDIQMSSDDRRLIREGGRA